MEANLMLATSVAAKTVRSIVKGSDASTVLENLFDNAPQLAVEALKESFQSHFFNSELIDLNYNSVFYRALLVYAGFPSPPAFRIKFESTILNKLFKAPDIGLSDIFNPVGVTIKIYFWPIRVLFKSLLSYFFTFYFPMKPLFSNVGIRDENLDDLLSHHSDRSARWMSTVLILYIILISFIVLMIGALIESFPELLTFWASTSSFASTVFTLITILSIFLLLTVPFRLVFRLINGYFAETICVRESLHLLLDINKNDLLVNPDRRQTLQFRIDALSKANSLLASRRYASKNKRTQEWIEEHFLAIEEFIRELEKWIVAPKEDTSVHLKNKVSWLSQIYIRGDYGRFEWEKDSYAKKPKTTGPWQGIGIRLLRLVGFSLPLIIMGLYLWNPNLFPFIATDLSNQITYLFIAWLLITIDISFDLGVVSELTSTAKGIKDLGS
jgi:hypothetical protein